MSSSASPIPLPWARLLPSDSHSLRQRSQCGVDRAGTDHRPIGLQFGALPRAHLERTEAAGPSARLTNICLSTGQRLLVSSQL